MSGLTARVVAWRITSARACCRSGGTSAPTRRPGLRLLEKPLTYQVRSGASVANRVVACDAVPDADR